MSGHIEHLVPPPPPTNPVGYLAEMLRMFFEREQLIAYAQTLGIGYKGIRYTAHDVSGYLLFHYGLTGTADELTKACPLADWYWILGVKNAPR